MSMYGDSRMHMEDWQRALMERAAEVGPRLALQEFNQVQADFLELYWTEQQGDSPCANCSGETSPGC